MTISSEISASGPYLGNGSTTVFPYEFKIVNESHIKVIFSSIDGNVSELSIGSGDYRVTGVGDENGGNVIKTGALRSGERLMIVRRPPFTQETSLTNQGPYYPDVVEDAFDKFVMQTQAVKEATDRSVKVEHGVVAPTIAHGIPNGSTLMLEDDRLVGGPDILALSNAAEIARNIAEGFASDIVSQGTVPIYATTDGLALITIPVGINAVRVNGKAAAGDGGGGSFLRVGAEPDHGAKFQSAGGVWWELQSFDVRFHGKFIAQVANEMATGQDVLVACFGDSTEAGYDNTLPPPYIDPLNAPAVAQNTLQNYHFNDGIIFENYGVSGTNSTAIIINFRNQVAVLKTRGCKSIVMNTGMNEMQSPTPVDINRTRMLLIAFEQIARSAGMAIIFKTPNPVWAVPGVGTMDKAERSKNYSQVVRDVCRATGAVLCDVYDHCIKLQSTGIWSILETIPDGVHPSNTIAGVYRSIGRLVASVFCHPQAGVDRPNQFLVAGGPGTTCFPTEGATLAKNTRMGLQVVSSDYNGPKTLNMLVMVETTGLDVVLAYPMWIGGIASANVLVDGVGIGTISQYNVGDYGTYYAQQHELTVIRNAVPGLHLIQISSASGVGAVAANYLRTRQTNVSKPYKNNAPYISHSRLLAPKLQMDVSNGSDNAICLLDHLPASRLNDGIDIEFEAKLAKGEFFIVHGLWAADNFSGAAVCGTAFGCAMGTGYGVIREGEGYSGFLDTVLNLVDLTQQERLWRISIPPGLNQPATLIIDGNAYTPHVLGKPYLGGWMGLQKNGNGTMIIKNLRMLDH
jgi:hypothetical protein